jgi:GDPmannose 4,6-dehydratase
MKSAIITGATGQDGAYLTQLLLDKGYRVTATHRRSSSTNFWRMRQLGLIGREHLSLVEYDIGDACAAIRLIEACEPDEIYNLAAQTHVGTSFQQPLTTSTINALGTLNLLEAIRTVDRGIRYYQASSAEMFGKVQSVPQNEATPFYPRSPYGVSKLFGHWMAVNYRESYAMFACSGILFNHESPLRGREFVTRRISLAAAAAAHGEGPPVTLGTLGSRRDWGYAKDYVEGMWLMLQAARPDDYVLATGRTETVRDFATMAFNAAGFAVEWTGVGADERAIDSATGREIVRVDPKLYRPAEVDLLIGDSRKASDRLNWRARTSVEDLCAMMVEADMEYREPAFPLEAMGTPASWAAQRLPAGGKSNGALQPS